MPSVSNVVTFKATDGTTYNSVDDWALTLESWDAQKPGGKWEYIDVPGAAGSLDVSRALSQDVPPKTRTLVFNFGVATGEHSQAVAVVDAVAAALHLQKMRIQTPDDVTAGLWYVGNCEITNFEYVGTGARIEVTAECEPYRYSAEGGTLTTGTAVQTEIEADKILAVPSAARTLARNVCAEYYTASNYPASADAIALCFAANSNLFDLDNATLRGVTTRTGTGTSWTKSNNIAQDGQKVAFGGVDVGWVERAAIVATSASVIPISGGERVFPFAEDTRARVWLFSDTITAVQSSVTADGRTYSAGAYLHYANGVWGTLDNGATFGGGGTTGAYGTIVAPAVGGAWNGEYLDFAINPNVTAFYIDLAGITAGEVYALVAFYKADETAPVSWIDPNVQVKVLQLPYKFTRYRDGSDITTDVFCNGIAESTFTSLERQTTYTLQKIEDEQDAAYIQAITANASGELIRFTWGYLLTSVTAYQMTDYSIDAGAQPSYPTVATGDLGAVVEYNGAIYLLPPSATTELDTLLNRGVNTVSVSTPQSAGSPSVITWPLGVL